MTIPLSDSPDFRHKKRRKIDTVTTTATTTSTSRWKSTAEQQTYSSKLITALRHVHNRHSPPSTATHVRAAADTTLAAAAKGRSRWSRAILTNRAKRRLKNHRKSKIRSKTPPPPPPAVTAEKTAAIEKRVRMLGKLVPGCKKISFPKLLEETSDYIAALQMQVRAMSELARLLSGSIDIEPESNNLTSIIVDDNNNPAH